METGEFPYAIKKSNEPDAGGSHSPGLNQQHSFLDDSQVGRQTSPLSPFKGM